MPWLLDPPWISEALEPEAYDSGQRKRYLRCEHERLQSLLKHPKRRADTTLNRRLQAGGQSGC